MKNLNNVIEDIQQAQVEAGGRFMRQKEIKEMTVQKLIESLLSNNVIINIKYYLNKKD